MSATFRNEDPLDLSTPDGSQAIRAALGRVRRRLGAEHGLWIGGTSVPTGKSFTSANPGDPSEIVGRFAAAGPADVDRALEVAWDAGEAWAARPVAERAECLRAAAALLREPEHRLDLDALLMLEIGKTRADAEHETARTIDALAFYAEEMLRRAEEQPPLVARPGERGRWDHRPLGAGAVVPIWSFPAAQVATYVGAAVVAGNSVVLKPSSAAPLIAMEIVRLLEEAGLPGGVVNVLTGAGPAVGAPLVGHPEVRFVCFNGSREVGLKVHEAAAAVHRGQGWLKRVHLEMGGKGCVVVDESADLDAAVEGVVASAFGFQGQRSAAASRAIVLDAVYDRFLQRLAPRVERLRVGSVEDPRTDIGPLIGETAFEFVRNLVATAHRDGRILIGGERVGERGWFLSPTVVADVDPISRIGVEEIFGPVVGVIRARDWDHALKVADNTDYGLTASVYTKRPARVEDAWSRLEVGTLFVNRPCVGALIGAHPAGGLRLSGRGPRRGGVDLLPFFLQTSLLVERTTAR